MLAEAVQAEQQQRAEEMRMNRDAEGQNIINEPEKVAPDNAEFIAAVSAKDESGKTSVQDSDRSMSTSAESWGLEELVFGTASMDSST